MAYAIESNQSLGIPWDIMLQLLSIPLCHPLPLQHHIPFTGSKPADANFEPLGLGLRNECTDLI